MSGYLWKHYLEDDVESFRKLLQTASHGGRAGANKSHGSNIGLGVGSPGSLGASPTVNIKGRKEAHGYSTSGASGGISVTRADINKRDAFGRTILHLAASSTAENAYAFATALLEQPLTDIYLQDTESGWTALHRAFYHGNISIACAIMNRDARDALGPSATGFLSHSGGLVKIKDREGNGPLDLFADTVDPKSHELATLRCGSGSGSGDEEENYWQQSSTAEAEATGIINVQGDEVFTFGSNKNVSLGFGDEDDRHFPERITLKRPEHLLQRFYTDQLNERANSRTIEGSVADLSGSLSLSTSLLPSVIRSKPIIIQDVFMSKFHTAVLTTDPESNLYMCGHGQGGRLGTGDQRTRYQFVCIEGGQLAQRKVTTVALGQNHTLAVSEGGNIFSWGNNACGQLGYALPDSGVRDRDPVVTLPRQIFGPLKREKVAGIAASRIHSVAHTGSALFTFGKNEGQLGIVDSDARSLEIQVVPRRVAASLFSANIVSVAAIDRATVCLLETYEVYIFANYGYAKVQFPLDMFTSPLSQHSFTATRYEATPNRITKVAAGGHTICAMSTAGEIYSMMVNQPTELAQDASTSTTNPTKIRGALSQPQRIWDLRRSHMAARDVGVDQDGSIILATDAGSVWRRVRRAKISTANQSTQYRAKDYKFSRISGLTRAVAVRSSGSGAYAAVRKDSHVTRVQIEVDSSSLWSDVFKLYPLKDMAEPRDDSDDEEPFPRFWNKPGLLDHIGRCIIGSSDADAAVAKVLEDASIPALPFDGQVRASSCDVSIPMHLFMLAGRSHVVRRGLYELRNSEDWSIADILSIEDDESGARPTVVFHGIDFLTVFDLVLYLYTDTVIDFWVHARHHPKMAFRYRAVRTELLKIATALDLPHLERAVRLQIPPKPVMNLDFETAIQDDTFLDNGDVLVQLAGGKELRVHSGMVCRRCPFFEGLFIGHASGRWLTERRGDNADGLELVEVDLKHINSERFKMVLRHIYADTGEDLFDDIVAESMDAFLDIVIEVMSIANELMLDRLSQICQKVVGRYVTVRNVSQLLNAIAPCSITEFKDKGLEYICLNLEALLAQGHIDELDEDLLFELDDVVRMVQLRSSEVTRSGIIDESLREAHPELEALIEAEKRAKIDQMMLQTRHFSADRAGPLSTSHAKGDYEIPIANKSPNLRGKPSTSPVLTPSPSLNRKRSAGDFIFEMDEDGDESAPLESSSRRNHQRTSSGIFPSPSPVIEDEQFYDSRGKKLPSPSQSASPSAHRSLVDVPFSRPSPPSWKLADTGSPWGNSPAASKLGLKDIMAQASSSRTSNITAALQSQARSKGPEHLPSGPFQTRPSQKERKKVQHAQSQQSKHADTGLVEAVVEGPVAAKKDSPWQRVQRPKPSMKDVASTPSSSPAVSQSVTAPSLTMRQTVPGNGKHHAAEVPPDPKKYGTTGQRPTVASSDVPQRQGSGLQDPPSMSNSSPSPIRSIRHTPRPRNTEATVGFSMADILNQQQAEKDTIREAATSKRSLQDIQQEQEFQEWWDLESRRVMEEERRKELLAARNDKAAKGGRGRGKSRRRGRHGDSGGATRADSETPIDAPNHRPEDGGHAQTARRGGKGRGGKDKGRAVGSPAV